MTSATSLSLLKGGTKNALDAELEAPKVAETAAETAAPTEEETVEIENMSAEQLEAFVTENAASLELPKNWSKLSLPKKKAYLNEKYGDDGDAEVAVTLTGLEPEAPAATETAKPVEMKSEDVQAQVNAAVGKTNAKKGGKGAKKGTSLVTSDAKTGEVETPGDDFLKDLVHQIENLNQEKALELSATLFEETSFSEFKLGGVLSVIQANGWYQPYTSFKEWASHQEKFSSRKATHLVSIYNALVEANIPWSKVKDVGWTKLKEIASIISNENVDNWVAVAGQNNTDTLRDLVKAHKKQAAGQLTSDGEEGAIKTTSSVVFKVHDDQREVIKSAIAKAKEDTGTTVDTAAITFVCQEYLSGMTMKERIKNLGLENALKLLDELYGTEFDINVSPVEDDAEAEKAA